MSNTVSFAESKTPIELLTENEAAEILRVKPKTLQAWRFGKTGPIYLKIGRLVKYRPSDLRMWLEKQKVEPTSLLERGERIERSAEWLKQVD